MIVTIVIITIIIAITRWFSLHPAPPPVGHFEDQKRCRTRFLQSDYPDTCQVHRDHDGDDDDDDVMALMNCGIKLFCIRAGAWAGLRGAYQGIRLNFPSFLAALGSVDIFLCSIFQPTITHFNPTFPISAPTAPSPPSPGVSTSSGYYFQATQKCAPIVADIGCTSLNDLYQNEILASSEQTLFTNIE